MTPKFPSRAHKGKMFIGTWAIYGLPMWGRHMGSFVTEPIWGKYLDPRWGRKGKYDINIWALSRLLMWGRHMGPL